MHRREMLILAKHKSQETLKQNQFNDFYTCGKNKILSGFSEDG